MTDIWVTSDTHFGHENIIKYCKRPFENADHMDEILVQNWNSLIKPNDKVYHLGDVYFGNKGRETLQRLNGKKRLILGNHDNGKDQALLKHFEKIDMWRMFSEYELLFTHVPVHPSTIAEGTNRRGQPRSLANIHGHIHDNRSPVGPYRCVCVEQTDYKPVHLDTLIQWRHKQ